jgi:zinc and cadmium transporter
LHWLTSLPTPLLLAVSGLAMALIALSGSLTMLMPADLLERLLKPFVAVAAGSLLGGALLHMLPTAIHQMGNDTPVWLWTISGFTLFLLLEQLLDWHHHHTIDSHHAPVTWLLLFADGLHNLIGGLAVGSAIIVSPELGLVAWVAAAAHEIPQELGDFGVLLHGGWSRGRALLANFVSALTFPVGCAIAWFGSQHLDVAPLVALGAGNFLYIAASDLVPELKGSARAPDAVQNFVAFLLGVALLLGVRLLFVG